MTTTQTETQPVKREDYTESREPVFVMRHEETDRRISVYFNGTVTGLEPDGGWAVTNLIPCLQWQGLD